MFKMWKSLSLWRVHLKNKKMNTLDYTKLKEKQIELLKKYNLSVNKDNKKNLYKQIMEIELQLENG